MKTEVNKDGKIFKFSSPLDSLPKALFFASFCLFFAVFTNALVSFLQERDKSVGSSIFYIISIIVSVLFCYRFVNKALLSEKLIVNKNELTLITGGLFNTKVNSYDITKIHGLRHLKNPELSMHPLAGESIDYLGFQTEQKVVNELHGDKQIGFHYEGRLVVFGENVTSWEFEQLKWRYTALLEMTCVMTTTTKKSVSVNNKSPLLSF